MGKFFSKFKYKAKAPETANSSAQNDNINLNDINLSNNINTSVMNGLRLVDTFCSFDSVLNVNAALGNLILIGHQNNYVINFLKS
ncbi:unnamed protein product [Brachionus calyciflorus]|uniref:Uncharacterized protein n=1 Tax=Brachionus calyciflorus TaxID=104777 RepID=A0A814E1J8_9BILA|nr:unnamed protein product [Brachionus calyciflorus]